MKNKFLVVGLNPTIQNTFTLPSLRVAQVNRVGRHRVDVAGKGANITRVLSQLGEKAVQLTFGGGRNLGLYRELCASDGIELRLVESDVEIRFCHTLLGESDRTTTEIVEPGSTVSGSLEESVLQLFESELESAHTVVIGGSHAPGFSAGLYASMVQKATAARARTLLDIRGDELVACLAHRPSAIKINVAEFSHTFTPESVLEEDTVIEDIPALLFTRMLEVHAETGAELVLTNGSQPVLLVVGEEVESIRPEPLEPVNAVGSGDAATAGLAAGVSRGLAIRAAVELAMECAATNVLLEKPGSIR